MIVTCGEALIDMLPRQGADGGPCFRPLSAARSTTWPSRSAGSAFRPGFFGGRRTISSDDAARALEKSRVDVSFAEISDRPTTLAFVTLIDGQAPYAFFDEHSAGRMLADGRPAGISGGAPGAAFRLVQPRGEPCGSAYGA